MGLLEERLQGKSLADYTNTQLRLALGAVLYTNTADMWKKYLNQLGYTGDVSQMLQKYYVDYNIPAVFRNYVNAGAGIYSPQQLFQDGSIGVLYDNNDLTTMFVDAAGTTPATVNGLVGLQLDKSQGLVLGPELTVNGDFASDTVWSKAATATISGGVHTFTAAASGDVTFQTVAYVLGTPRTYLVSFTVSGYVSGSVAVKVGASLSVTASANGTYTGYIQSAATNQLIEIQSRSVGTTLSVDNVSVKELPGNHRYQSTTGSKPVLRGTPTGGNLVTNGDFSSDTTGWTSASGGGTATVSSGVVTLTNGASGFHRIAQAITTTSGRVYRIRSTNLSANSRISVSSANDFGQNVLGVTSATEVYFTATSSTSYIVLNCYVATAGATATFDNISVHDVSAGSVTAPYGLQYDGVDDFLQTASVNFSSTDKMFVCAGVRKLSDAAQGILVELSAAIGSNNGAFMVLAPSSAGVESIGYYSKGTLQANGAFGEPGLAANTNLVVSGISAISTDELRMRLNGTQKVSLSSDQGTGNFGNYPLYIGRRGGTTLPLNGLDFGFVIVGKTLTSAQISSTERWIAQRTGVSI